MAQAEPPAVLRIHLFDPHIVDVELHLLSRTFGGTREHDTGRKTGGPVAVQVRYFPNDLLPLAGVHIDKVLPFKPAGRRHDLFAFIVQRTAHKK